MTQVQVDALVTAADFSLIIGGIAGIAAAVALVLVVVKGVGFINGALKRG